MKIRKDSFQFPHKKEKKKNKNQTKTENKPKNRRVTIFTRFCQSF